MKYAVIQISGKQFKVAEGDVLTINKANTYDYKVLAYSEDSKLSLGDPFLTNVNVTIEPEKDLVQKTTVFRYKSKARYRKTKGHKQPLVKAVVKKISKVNSKKEESAQ